MASALKQTWAEEQKETVPLPDVGPNAFGWFEQYLYGGKGMLDDVLTVVEGSAFELKLGTYASAVNLSIYLSMSVQLLSFG